MQCRQRNGAGQRTQEAVLWHSSPLPSGVLRVRVVRLGRRARGGGRRWRSIRRRRRVQHAQKLLRRSGDHVVAARRGRAVLQLQRRRRAPPLHILPLLAMFRELVDGASVWGDLVQRDCTSATCAVRTRHVQGHDEPYQNFERHPVQRDLQAGHRERCVRSATVLSPSSWCMQHHKRNHDELICRKRRSGIAPVLQERLPAFTILARRAAGEFQVARQREKVSDVT